MLEMLLHSLLAATCSANFRWVETRRLRGSILTC